MDNLETDHKFLQKSTLFGVVGTVLKICGPLLTFLLARIFGPAEFGFFVSTQALLLTISHSSTLGLDKGLYWFLPQNRLNGNKPYDGIMGSFWIATGIAFISTVIILILAFTGLVAGELSWYALALVFYSGSFVLSNTSEGNRKPQNAIFINSFLVAVLSPLSSIAMHFAGIPHALPLGLLSGQVCGMAAHALLVRRQFGDMPWKPDIYISKKLLLYSLPLGLNEVVTSFIIRSALWMVMLFLGAESAGAYAIMVTISNGVQTIRVSFNPIITPVVAGMNKDRLQTDLKPVFTYCVRMVTLIQLVIAFFIVLFPGEVMSLAGKGFIRQPEALGILLFMQILMGFFDMSSTIINGIGKSLYTLKMNTVCLAVALISGYFLIPRFGLVGAALSMFSQNLTSMIWNNIYLYKLRLWPYSLKLVPQLIWMLALLILYIVLNCGTVEFVMWQKISIYAIIFAALGLQFSKQKNRNETNKRR